MAEAGEEQRPIVIDNGSGVVKAGYGGDDHPCSVFASIIAKPKTQQIIVGGNGGSGDEYFIGDEA